jgi:replicative DNA helicase
MADLAQAPLDLASAGHLTVQAMIEHLTELNDEARLLIVDTINAVRVPPRRGAVPREQEISTVISDLKALALDRHVPVVVTASLNRGPSYRIGRVPTLDDVRDSGQLVDVADVVLLLHRPDMAEKESPRAGEADFIVAKSRLTPTDTITVAFQGHYSRFVDMAP